MLRITMLTAIIRARTTSCCSLATQTFTARALYDVASDWEGSCVITIKKPRELACKSWMIAVGLDVEVCLRNDDYDFWPTRMCVMPNSACASSLLSIGTVALTRA